ncbi:hypothetical protein L596_030156 [Steinernema carpocapsae]|uniref:TIL domain-containing protein n=1 Tax=Steinernema carpocapsae TaxID=34508 RepID=A0A4U5LRW3_STECR|nr:hypothetical protein L596_030156 [Steinernema carpocapsae]
MPLYLSEPCTIDPADSKYYQVKLKNRKFSPNAAVSWIVETEFVFAGQKFFLDEKLNFLVNGQKNFFPYYYPSKDAKKVSVENIGGTIYAQNEFGVLLKFAPYYVHLTVPQIPEFLGRDKLCGIAGNLNNICEDDLIGKNKNGLINKQCHTRRTSRRTGRSRRRWTRGLRTTSTAEGYLRDRRRTSTEAARLRLHHRPPRVPADPPGAPEHWSLRPVRPPRRRRHPELLRQLRLRPVLRGRPEGAKSSPTLPPPARTPSEVCSDNSPQTHPNSLADADLKDWRRDTGCPLTCPANSVYGACISGCQPTCSNPNPGDKCDKPCFDGCRCNAGFVLDTTQVPAKCDAQLSAPASTRTATRGPGTSAGSPATAARKCVP